MLDFSQLSTQLSNSDVINAALHYLKEIESDVFFSIAINKEQTFQRKQAHFKNKSFENIFVVKNQTNFGYADSEIDGKKISFINTNFFTQNHLDEIAKDLKNSLVIMTNNIFAEISPDTFSTIYQKTDSTIFAVHDYDNHHWLQNSAQIALLADVYIPAHQENLLIASRLNPNIIGGIPCGSNQWSQEFIASSTPLANSTSRKNDPLGKYHFYEKFIYRNKSIRTLESSYPNITILNEDFHTLTQEQKWEEWTSHKLHWIIPVLNDLPIRFFDSLLTGGIPIIPKGLVSHLEALTVPKDFYIAYTPLDILEPKSLIEKSLTIFEGMGDEGISKRHHYALEHFHIDAILKKIISRASRLYDISDKYR